MRSLAALVILATLGCEREHPPPPPPPRDTAPDPAMLPVGIDPPPEPETAPARARDSLPSPATIDRRATWLSEGFRCRAISTTRLRPCRFEEHDGEIAIEFPVADLRCQRVLFDEAGDPRQLEQCRSSWLGVPATIPLQRHGDTWSGAHSGWSWGRRGSGDPYCCPGVWIAAPETLVFGDPIDADHDVPLPKPPRAR